MGTKKDTHPHAPSKTKTPNEKSGALRVFVALGRIILDLWAAPHLAPPQCGYWGSMGFFCSAPQDFGLLGFFCARFPPREASRYLIPICNLLLKLQKPPAPAAPREQTSPVHKAARGQAVTCLAQLAPSHQAGKTQGESSHRSQSPISSGDWGSPPSNLPSTQNFLSR